VSLSKRARKDIAAFNRVCDWQYKVTYQNAIDKYVKSYQGLKELEVEERKLDEELGGPNAEIDNQIG